MTSSTQSRTESSIVTEESQNEEGRFLDLDKYEGHTTGPWVVNNPDDYEKSLIFSVGELKFVSSANTQLIADAPLLLAEVKRLTAMFEETNHHLDLMVGAFGIEPLVEMVGEEE